MQGPEAIEKMSVAERLDTIEHIRPRFTRRFDNVC